jgi:hypothetical protein
MNLVSTPATEEFNDQTKTVSREKNNGQNKARFGFGRLSKREFAISKVKQEEFIYA